MSRFHKSLRCFVLSEQVRTSLRLPRGTLLQSSLTGFLYVWSQFIYLQDWYQYLKEQLNYCRNCSLVRFDIFLAWYPGELNSSHLKRMDMLVNYLSVICRPVCLSVISHLLSHLSNLYFYLSVCIIIYLP